MLRLCLIDDISDSASAIMMNMKFKVFTAFKHLRVSALDENVDHYIIDVYGFINVSNEKP